MLHERTFGSGAIERFAYDPNTRALYVFFKTGGVYGYRDVGRATFDAFRGAGSKGQFFRSDIRNRFASQRLSQSEVGELERELERGASGGTTQLVLVEIATIERPNRSAVFF
jgi:KTSC domain-containing protein